MAIEMSAMMVVTSVTGRKAHMFWPCVAAFFPLLPCDLNIPRTSLSALSEEVEGRSLTGEAGALLPGWPLLTGFSSILLRPSLRAPSSSCNATAVTGLSRGAAGFEATWRGK